MRKAPHRIRKAGSLCTSRQRAAASAAICRNGQAKVTEALAPFDRRATRTRNRLGSRETGYDTCPPGARASRPAYHAWGETPGEAAGAPREGGALDEACV